jgi:8-oxo-dGTP diphosphatase
VAALTPVRAAGGVVWRPSGAGPEVCLVHRPRYDDWSLPKGKLAAGEPTLAAAVREVLEETAVRGVPQIRLPSVSYRVRDGAMKAVDYWSMRELKSGRFTPNDEVDGVRWLPVAEAERLVSYQHDVAVLRAFATLPLVSAIVVLVRHGWAGDRHSWSGPDADRPLDLVGERQAQTLSELLVLFAPGRLVSASPRRCRQTLAVLAERLDLPVEVDPTFDEAAAPATRAAARLVELAGTARSTVVCSQGEVIPPTLSHLLGGSRDPERYHTAKGAGWLLAFAGPVPAGADPIEID